jgi:rhomboid family protein
MDFRNIPPVVKNLLIINGLFYLASIILYNSQHIDLTDYLGLHYWESDGFQPFQLVTHMFMHSFFDVRDGSIVFAHILFNMFGLWMFGSTLEGIWGGKRFLIFYMIAGIGAAIVHLIVIYIKLQILSAEIPPEVLAHIYANGYEALSESKNYIDASAANFNGILNSSAVGASGALYGILVAYGVLFPNTKLMLMFFPVPVKAKYFIPGIILVDLFLGVGNFSWDSTAHFAHL